MTGKDSAGAGPGRATSHGAGHRPRSIARALLRFALALAGLALAAAPVVAAEGAANAAGHASPARPMDYVSAAFVFMLATFIGIGVIRRVSRLLHTPLMSLTNAISAIAVVGAIVVTGADYPPLIRFLGGVALFASMTNIVSGFLITGRMLKMFKKRAPDEAGGRR